MRRKHMKPYAQLIWKIQRLMIRNKTFYELIWKRTIASQMAMLNWKKLLQKLRFQLINKSLTAQGEVLKFDGFLKVYLEE